MQMDMLYYCFMKKKINFKIKNFYNYIIKTKITYF